MTETTQEPQTADPDVPHEDELDIEGPNESAPGRNAPGEDPSSDDA